MRTDILIYISYKDAKFFWFFFSDSSKYQISDLPAYIMNNVYFLKRIKLKILITSKENGYVVAATKGSILHLYPTLYTFLRVVVKTRLVGSSILPSFHFQLFVVELVSYLRYLCLLAYCLFIIIVLLYVSNFFSS
jgi:hypothetical protein